MQKLTLGLIVNIKFFVIAGLIGIFPLQSQAQVLDNILDFFEFTTNKKQVEVDSTRYENTMVLAPIVNYAPETSVGFGVGAKYLFKFKNSSPETRTSNMPVSAIYTLNNQYILWSGYTIFFNDEAWLLKGNIQYADFPQLFYGLGRDSRLEDEEIYSFNNLLIEPILLKRVIGKLFVGGGIRYSSFFNQEIEADGILNTDRPLGFDGSTSLGAELAISYDSRDNVLNANSGVLLEFTQGYYTSGFGGEFAFQLTRLDLRAYFLPFQNRRDVLAFQFKSFFSNGDVPLAELSLFGGDEIMRGYYEGRFRDNHLLAGQVEYRLPLFSRFGMVAFAGIGDVAGRVRDFKLENIRASIGVGLRFKIVPTENLNIRMDFGVTDEDQNFYLNIAEAF